LLDIKYVGLYIITKPVKPENKNITLCGKQLLNKTVIQRNTKKTNGRTATVVFFWNAYTEHVLLQLPAGKDASNANDINLTKIK